LRNLVDRCAMRKRAAKNEKQAATPPRLHTTEELAATISYHVVTVRDAIRAGRIHALRFGRAWRIPNDEFERIVANGLPVERSAA
jgi:excisionase family DNA binding protein